MSEAAPADRRKRKRKKLRGRQLARRGAQLASRPPAWKEKLVDLPPKRDPSDLDLDAKAVILACSGPSLSKVDIWAPGLPVCAVSTVIRDRQFEKHRPEYWILVDRINQHHGETGTSMGRAADVIKVSPWARQRTYGKWPGWQFHRREQRHVDRNLGFGESQKMLCGANQSSAFACQWLSLVGGFSTVIFAGCDFQTGPGAEHCHDRRLKIQQRARQAKNLARVLDLLREWTPVAREMGITFMSWSPGSPIEKFMERYEWPRQMQTTSSTRSTSQ